jgi:hypothetical protein
MKNPKDQDIKGVLHTCYGGPVYKTLVTILKETAKSYRVRYEEELYALHHGGWWFRKGHIRTVPKDRVTTESPV